MNIRKIAELAGVSPATVSKVINEKDGDIAPETRQRVLKIIREYNYVPYGNRRRKHNTQNNLVGVIIPNNSNNNKFNKLLSSIENTLSQSGYGIVLATYEQNLTIIEKVIEQTLAKRIGALVIIADEVLDDKLLSLIPNDVIYTLIGQNQVGDVVYCDLSNTDYSAAKKLLDTGHASIAYLAVDNKNRYRYSGFVRALNEKGIEHRSELLIVGSTASEAIKEGVSRILGSRVGAVVCQTSEIAYLACQQLQLLAIRIPDDISLICLEEDCLLSQMSPSIDVVTYNFAKLGEDVANNLITAIEKRLKIIQDNQPELLIIERQSVGAPAAYRQKHGDRIVVVGSMNMDAVIQVHKAPDEEETIIATAVTAIPGGKGANQAICVSKLAGDAHAIGRLGNDNEGRDIYQNLVTGRVKTEGIVFDEKESTGKAYVTVAETGSSTIIVHAGANDLLSRKQIQDSLHIFDKAKICLIQTEIQYDTVSYVVSLCKERDITVLLKPSGLRKIDKELLFGLDFFIPNRTELEILVKNGSTIEEKAQELLKDGVKNIIVTLGKKGSILINRDEQRHFPATDVKVVDTTGASDAFIGAMGVYLSEGRDIYESIEFATCVAGISIISEGVQPALPDRLTAENFKKYAKYL